MTRVRSLFTAVAFGALLVSFGNPAYAQLKQAPKPKPGICAPWSRCVAEASIALAVGFVLFTTAMYAYQRRGFSTVEHKQGSPDGVPSKRPE